MKLFIKNLAGEEDETVIKTILQQFGINFNPEIDLGEISLSPTTSTGQLADLTIKLGQKGYFILNDRKKILSEQVKLAALEMLAEPKAPNVNYSRYLSNRLNLNYTYLANIFSEMQGITIEHFIIDQKIAMAKKFIADDGYNVSEAADKLHYSSIGHFSNQFKKVTGQSPSEFKKNIRSHRLTDPARLK